MFCVSEIITSELLSLNCLSEEEDTFHREAMCWQAVPRFGMTITETFAKSIDLAVFNEYDKDAAIQILTVLAYVYHVDSRIDVVNGTF